MTRLSLVATALLLAGCPKDKPAEVDAAAPVATVSSALPSATASASAKPKLGGTFEGSYTAAASPLYIPSENKEYASVKQAKDDPSKMVGDGTLSIVLDGEGRLAGTIDSGPVSPAVIDGVVADGAISGTVRRKDPSDDGLSGSFTGKLAGGGLDLIMKLSDANASTLREAKASLKKK